MSVSLLEVIEAAGYDLSTPEDAKWLLGVSSEFEKLTESAEELIEKIENEELAQSEKDYQERFGND